MRRKRKSERKEETIRVLVTVEQKKKLGAAAKATGLSVSSWLLSVGLCEVER